MRCFFKHLLFLIFSLLPTITMALGFGEVKLYSYLNEPLDAEIELLGAENFDPNRILVTLASAQEFKRAGLDRPFLLSNMQFQVERRNDHTFIKIISTDAIHQPYLEYLLDLSWPGGRLVRGYTLLLDPAPSGTPPLHERRPPLVKIPQETSFTAQNSVTHQDRFEKLFDEKSAENFTQESPPMTIVSTVSQQRLQAERQRAEHLEADRSKNIAMQANPNLNSNPNQNQHSNLNSNPNSNLNLDNNSQKAKEIETQKTNIFAFDQNQFWTVMISFSILTLFMALFVIHFRHKKKIKPLDNQLVTDPLHTLNPNFLLDEATKNISPQVASVQNEMSMKLELARYYFEIEDEDSALQLLRDIMSRGSDWEKQQAQRILESKT